MIVGQALTAIVCDSGLCPSLYPCMLANISLTHQLKNTDDIQFGEHSWTFKHP
ncbi:hypothetical protein SCLCIDRAFT_1219406, partial [Scleroderma citrinum Foug A]